MENGSFNLFLVLENPRNCTISMQYNPYNKNDMGFVKQYQNNLWFKGIVTISYSIHQNPLFLVYEPGNIFQNTFLVS